LDELPLPVAVPPPAAPVVERESPDPPLALQPLLAATPNTNANTMNSLFFKAKLRHFTGLLLLWLPKAFGMPHSCLWQRLFKH
jgi:hypothetical protein